MQIASNTQIGEMKKYYSPQKKAGDHTVDFFGFQDNDLDFDFSSEDQFNPDGLKSALYRQRKGTNSTAVSNQDVAMSPDCCEYEEGMIRAVDDLLSSKIKRLQLRKRDSKTSDKASAKKLVINIQKCMEDEQSESERNTSIKRVRKNRDQLKALKRAYEECEGKWTKDDQKEIAYKLCLSEQ